MGRSADPFTDRASISRPLSSHWLDTKMTSIDAPDPLLEEAARWRYKSGFVRELRRQKVITTTFWRHFNDDDYNPP